MKVTAIGDIHGRNTWEDIVETSSSDHTVFIGDYFDSRSDIPAYVQIDNFKNILSYSRTHAGKVSLLLGNHDFHYLPVTSQRYLLYQDFKAIDIKELLGGAIKDSLMHFAKEIDDVLYTHAGVTNTWLKNNGYQHGEDIEDFINSMYQTSPQAFEIQAGSRTGDDVYQSPIWVRPRSLEEDAFSGKQVVGHTMQPCITFSHGKGDIAYIDTLSKSREHLIVKDGVFHVPGRKLLSKEEKEEFLNFFELKGEALYMKYNPDFEYNGLLDGDVPSRGMISLNEGEVFGVIGDKKLFSPCKGLMMSMCNRRDTEKFGFHFILREMR